MNTPGNKPGNRLAAGGWLHLAAAPTFAAMALATAASGDDPAHMLCQAVDHGPLSLGSMAFMYLLMAIFHATPWWKWIALEVRSRTRTKKVCSPDSTAAEPRRR